MASLTNFKMITPLFIAFSLLIQGALGEIDCENLPNNLCAFSIASSGKRCVLENYKTKKGIMEYQCRTSDVVVERMSELIESDECVNACGVDRTSVGFSSDALVEAHFASKLCSPACFHRCPNIVDLYFNLAAGEGVFLPKLCKAQRSNPHRVVMELLSSGAAAGPVSNKISSSFVAEVIAPEAGPVSNGISSSFVEGDMAHGVAFAPNDAFAHDGALAPEAGPISNEISSSFVEGDIAHGIAFSPDGALAPDNALTPDGALAPHGALTPDGALAPHGALAPDEGFMHP